MWQLMFFLSSFFSGLFFSDFVKNFEFICGKSCQEKYYKSNLLSLIKGYSDKNRNVRMQMDVNSSNDDSLEEVSGQIVWQQNG